MKKIIVILASAYLFFMFLVYSNVFRNFSDPVEVTKYFLECFKNREGFLTYQISEEEFFNEDREGTFYQRYGLGNSIRIEYSLIKIENAHAFVRATIFHKRGTPTNLFVALKKDASAWKIREITAEKDYL